MADDLEARRRKLIAKGRLLSAGTTAAPLVGTRGVAALILFLSYVTDDPHSRKTLNEVTRVIAAVDDVIALADVEPCKPDRR